MLKIEGGRDNLLDLVVKQLNNFFSVTSEEGIIINVQLDYVLHRTYTCFFYSKNKYYKRDNQVFFNPFHSGQYSIFLYYLSNSLSVLGNKSLADRVYYLNKALNAFDLYHEVEMPDYFFLDHPVGAVIGRASYGNGFEFGQNVTVGNNKGIYPRFGKNVRLCANSMVLGNSTVGDNVIVGPGVCIKDTDIPSNVLVFGTSPNLIFKTRKDV